MVNDFGLPGVKSLTFYQTRAGDRITTPAQKRKIKEEQGFKCAICKKKYPPRLLEIHHKKEVHKHKNRMVGDLPVYSLGKKIKPKYDRRSNLQAVCVFCHDKTKSKKGMASLKKKTTKKKTKRKATKKKKRQQNIWEAGGLDIGF